jgi:hypothetical protein
MSRHTWYVRAGAVLTLVTMAAAAAAHHSFSAEFDAKKPVVLQGTVTKARFVNPHSWLYLDVKDAKGAVTKWGFEFGTPSTLRDKGLTKDDVRPGVVVRVDGFRARNGGPFGYARQLTLPGGRTVQTGGAVDAPPAAAGRPRS